MESLKSAAIPESSSSSRRSTHDAQIAAVFADRYRVTRALRGDSEGETLLAIDEQSRQQVVIKAIPFSGLTAGAGAARIRTRTGRARENWKSVSGFIARNRPGRRLLVLHPQLCSGTNAGGTTAARSRLKVWRNARCQPYRLLKAIQALHGHAVLHRNIKPSNLILADPLKKGTVPLGNIDLSGENNSSKGHRSRLSSAGLVPMSPEATRVAVLVDGGFWKGGSVEPTASAPEVAAALYLSPEQAGLIECGLGEPSDLYAVGLILFECLSGRPPFAGDSVSSILLSHITAKVPRLHVTHPQVPRALDDLIHRLFCGKIPHWSRYQSAAAVLEHDLEQIAAALASGDSDPDLVLGRSDRRRTLTAPAFVSRRRELDELGNQLSRTKNGPGRARAGRGGRIGPRQEPVADRTGPTRR